jgi:hypothetical protein
MNPKFVSLLYKHNETTDLIVHGQGVFIFENKYNTDPCVFNIVNQDKSNGLEVTFTHKSVSVKGTQNITPFVDISNNSGLVDHAGAYYWFSLDSQNQKLCAGVGEARIENVIYQYVFPASDKDQYETTKAFLESLIKIQIDHGSIKGLRLLRDPITMGVPLLVKNKEELTMDIIASGTHLPKANMSLMAQKLYDCIAGRKFLLDTPDFPDFSKAIEYSIATPGLWCNKRLQEKSREFNKDKPNLFETYLRITLSQNNGESPGIPYVMEIWPVGHYSPIHNHGDSEAVIRVLHGAINVSLYPFLCAEKDGIKPFAQADFVKGDITWISPTLNQVHKLKNLDSSKQTCITIQCYMYDNENLTHYDYFDYIDADGKQQQYEPDSDMDFIKFKQLMKTEWAARRKKTLCEKLMQCFKCL